MTMGEIGMYVRMNTTTTFKGTSLKAGAIIDVPSHIGERWVRRHVASHATDIADQVAMTITETAPSAVEQESAAFLLGADHATLQLPDTKKRVAEADAVYVAMLQPAQDDATDVTNDDGAADPVDDMTAADDLPAGEAVEAKPRRGRKPKESTAAE
jgi:hypothetical protein